MITHYGLFRSERDVFWGRRKNKGQLLGRTKTPLGHTGAPKKMKKRRPQTSENMLDSTASTATASFSI